MVGCLFVLLGIVAFYSKKPVGFWNVCNMAQVTDVKKYNRAVGKLWCIAGVCFAGLGVPLLAEQNSLIILVSVAGSLVWTIAVMAIYELGIMRKYRRQELYRHFKMRIEHIAMHVNDLEGARDFFVKYFDASANDGYVNHATGFQSYFLHFEDGARLEIMNKPHMSDADKALVRTGYSHIAFSVGSRERVDALTDRLVSDGYQVLSGPRTTGDGYYESCIVGIEGNQIEITI